MTAMAQRTEIARRSAKLFELKVVDHKRRLRQRGVACLRTTEALRVGRGRGIPECQVHNWVVDHLGDEPWSLGPGQAGEALNLTFAEKIKYAVRSMRAVDCSPEQVSEFYHEKRKERDRIRVARKRAAAKEARGPAPISKRAANVLLLIGETPVRVTDLVASATKIALLKNSRGRAIGEASMYRGVHRAVLELFKRGYIERSKIEDMRGAVIVVRRK